MNTDLLNGLHDNLWQSLRHIFNTDRVLLGVAYLVNFSGFVLFLSLLPEQILTSIISFFCLMVLNGLFMLSILNSKKEVNSTIETLSEIYKDQELSQYFNEGKADYYAKRYNLWLILVPALFIFASTIAVAIEYLT